jgi:hypothetical protein
MPDESVIPEKPKQAPFSGTEALPEGEHRAPGSRSRVSLEEKQFQLAKRRAGNPNLKKGEIPYNLNLESFRNWLEDHPEHDRKLKITASEAVRRFLREPVDGRNKAIGRTEGGVERFVKIMESLYITATMPKSRNQVKAAELLLAYGWGKPKAAEEDLQAIKKGGLTLVYVDRREIDPDIPVAPKNALQGKNPEFIDAEFSEDRHAH